jgi:hypothetical protein
MYEHNILFLLHKSLSETLQKQQQRECRFMSNKRFRDDRTSANHDLRCEQPSISTNGKNMKHKSIPEGHTVNKEKYTKILSGQGYWEKETPGKLGMKQLVSSVRQRTCTSVVGDQKVPCQAQCDGFGASAIFLELVTARLSLVSTTKKCSERTTIHVCQGSHCKSDKITDRGIEIWFPGMLSKALRTLAKVCHCPSELLCTKCCVNRYEVTYFCVINQFWEVFLKLLV